MTTPRRGARPLVAIPYESRFSTYRDIHCVDLAPLRGAIRFIIGSGGLRGLRPPATFFATLRVALRSVNYINTLAKPRLGFSSGRCSAAKLSALTNAPTRLVSQINNYRSIGGLLSFVDF